MKPQVGELNAVMADDIAGVNAIYAPWAAPSCGTTWTALNRREYGFLEASDCQMSAIFGGKDNSVVDRYQLQVATEQRLYMHVKASGFEPVLLANLDRVVLDVFPSTGGCEAKAATAPLPPGTYVVLVNTYEEPTDCGAGQGRYELVISDSPLPVLGEVRTFGQSGGPEGFLFQAGAALSGGQDYTSLFAATDSIDVDARIITARHAGQQGAIYVVVILDDGRSYMKDTAGNFVRWSGQRQDLQPTLYRVLGSPMEVEVIKGFHPGPNGLAGHTFHVFIGYSMLSNPDSVYYPSTPLSFYVAP